MITELRQKSQITIPKDILTKLGLSEGDKLDISVKDGGIFITPLVVYSKSDIDDLKKEIDYVKTKIASGKQPLFDTVDALFEKLEG